MVEETIFSDIDLGFGINMYRDVSTKKNSSAIKQSVRNIVLAPKGSGKLFDMDYGTIINQLLFENISDSLLGDAFEDDVENILLEREPRIKNVRVEMESIDHKINIEIYYTIKNFKIDDSVSIVVERIR